MTQAATAIRSTGPTQPAKTTPLSELVSSKGNGLKNRTLLHSLEGWGKTSLLTYSNKPIFIQSKGETGVETLIESGQIPETPHFPEATTWEEIKSHTSRLITEDHGFSTYVLDTVNGAERLCHEATCLTHFNGDWGERGFASYGRGPEIALAEWRLFLNQLDELRMKRKMSVFLLAHTRVQNFKNPEGPDYDRYEAELHKTTWAMTKKWVDVILFGNFETVIDTDKATKRGKGKGGSQRIMCTQREASYDAKNRLGLPAIIDMGSSAVEGWSAFMGAVKEAKANGIQAVSTGVTQ